MLPGATDASSIHSISSTDCFRCFTLRGILVTFQQAVDFYRLTELL